MKNKVIIIIILVYSIIITLQKYKYFWFYPTIPLYPNNIDESNIVKLYTKTRTQDDIDFFKLTDPSVSHAFTLIVPENVEELNLMFRPISSTIISLKLLFNRARPKQVNNTIKVLASKTANTPSWPSGHAGQAYYLAKLLTKKYPHLKRELHECAEKCANARIYAGLHYESDNSFSKYIVSIF